MGDKKYVAFIACILAISIIFSGCGKSTSSSAANSNGGVIYGKVTAIDGKSITIALAGNGGKNDGKLSQGNAPAQPSGAPSGQQPQGSPPAQPSGALSGQQPQGNAPAQPSGAPSGQQPQGSPPTQPSGAPNGQQPQGGGPGGFTLTGESKTIKVTDSTVVTTSSFGQNTTTKASLSDIKVDSILSVSMSGDTVATITIMNAGDNDKGPVSSTSASSADISSVAVSS